MYNLLTATVDFPIQFEIGNVKLIDTPHFSTHIRPLICYACMSRAVRVGDCIIDTYIQEGYDGRKTA
jgi:hypothetical protein